MHEMSIAQSIVEIACAEAEDATVRLVRVAIGALSHVDPRALAFGFDVAARGTIAEDARLAIDRPAGQGFCVDCTATIAVEARGAACPGCGGHKWILTGGDEMRVVELEVE